MSKHYIKSDQLNINTCNWHGDKIFKRVYIYICMYLYEERGISTKWSEEREIIVLRLPVSH